MRIKPSGETNLSCFSGRIRRNDAYERHDNGSGPLELSKKSNQWRCCEKKVEIKPFFQTFNKDNSSELVTFLINYLLSNLPSNSCGWDCASFIWEISTVCVRIKSSVFRKSHLAIEDNANESREADSRTRRARRETSGRCMESPVVSRPLNVAVVALAQFSRRTGRWYIFPVEICAFEG